MGFFEHLASNEETDRGVARKALALARARANNRFANFVDKAETVVDRDARLALVAGDLEDTVRQACADVDHSDWEGVLEAVQSHLGMVVEARKPKTCPYHREVMDISLAAGEPQAGFAAMAQHAWGSNHCQGEWEGGCNFKPEMVTQTFWDQKAEKAQQRRQEREERIQQEQQVQEQEFAIEEPVMEAEPETFGGDETSAVGIGAEPAVAAPEMAMAAHVAAGATLPGDNLGAVERVSVEGEEGPVPKIDKKPWTPENVNFIDADMADSPNPTRHVDILEPVAYGKDFEAIDDWSKNTLEKQKVTDTADYQGDKAHGGNWPAHPRSAISANEMKACPDCSGRGGSTPGANNCPSCGGSGQVKDDLGVANSAPGGSRSRQKKGPNLDQIEGSPAYFGATDPDKNPIAELLSEEEASRAIADFNQGE